MTTRRTTTSNSASSFTLKDMLENERKKSGARTGAQDKKRPKRRSSRNTHRRKPSGQHKWMTEPGQHASGRTRRGDRGDESAVPPVREGDVRIIPLGGVEEVGKNMTVIETKDDIFIVDMGFQFREEKTPGVDYILPNTKYLETRREKIRGVFITHGHLDHIGAIPYIMERIGNPPIYARNLTAIMIQKRQEEFPHLPALDMHIVEKGDRIRVGNSHIEFFEVTHTVPDSMGVIIETAHGDIVCTGDLKLEHKDGIPSEREEKEFARFKDRTVLALLMDSTNVEQPGFSIPEEKVLENIYEIIKNTEGRLIFATFASLIDRLIKVVEYAETLNKKIVIDGRSMKTNMEIAKAAGLMKTKKGTIIPIEEMDNYPPNRIVALVTGAQGDEFASLMRAANKTHKYIKINKRDTILLSSSIVPGNERAVQVLKDNLSRQGAKIVHYRVSDVHSSGHANADESAWIHRKVAPRFFIPIHGYHYMLRVHTEIARSVGIPENHTVVPDNGMIIEIQNKGRTIKTLKEKAASNIVMVDGFSVGDIQDVVLRDRKTLSQDGMFVVVAVVDLRTGKVRKSPDIISRGFVYLRESQDLLRHARGIAKKTIEDSMKNARSKNFEDAKERLTDNIERFLVQKTAKRPIVLPVIIGV